MRRVLSGIIYLSLFCFDICASSKLTKLHNEIYNSMKSDNINIGKDSKFNFITLCNIKQQNDDDFFVKSINSAITFLLRNKNQIHIVNHLAGNEVSFISLFNKISNVLKDIKNDINFVILEEMFFSQK